jgi:hypothetical protein
MQDSHRRVTGWLLVVAAVAFAVAGGTSLVWTWFAVAWTYAILLVLRTGMLARWVGWSGLVAGVLYLTGQATSWPRPCPASPSGTWAGYSPAPSGAPG